MSVCLSGVPACGLVETMTVMTSGGSNGKRQPRCSSGADDGMAVLKPDIACSLPSAPNTSNGPTSTSPVVGVNACSGSLGDNRLASCTSGEDSSEVVANTGIKVLRSRRTGLTACAAHRPQIVEFCRELYLVPAKRRGPHHQVLLQTVPIVNTSRWKA